MDAQAERRFQQLKKRLDALHYTQPLTIESAALAEKLLNDLLKTTEGFQKLKKINEELKTQVSSDNLYVILYQLNFQQLDPLKRENERIVKENNELHMQMIKLKEETAQLENSMKAKLKQCQNEKTDLQFLLNQKDFKIQEVDKTVMDMKSKLDKALQKAYNPQANDIVKGLKKEINQQDNIIGKKQEFVVSKSIDSQNIDPNRGFSDIQSQQSVWAEELRRADERALKYKQDIVEVENKKQEYEQKVKEMEKAIQLRDQEIQRLGFMYRGGQNFDTVKGNFDKQTAEDTIQKLSKQNEFLNQENHRLDAEMQEIKELLGICESRDPTDKDRANLKKLVRELKARNDQMVKDMKNLESVIEQLKEGKFDMMQSTKMMGDQDVNRMKVQIEDSIRTMEDLRKENTRLKNEYEKVIQNYSAFQSNNKAYIEKVEELSQEVRDKEEQLRQLERNNNQLEVDTQRLKEELNLYKGRCSTLQRDIELSNNFMNKLSTDNNSQQDQFNYLKERVRQLEQELERAIRDRTDCQMENKRLETATMHLEKDLQELKFEKLKVQGDSANSGATVQRLQAQLQGRTSEVDILNRQKEELEKLLKNLKTENLEAEKKAADYYQQLLRVNENFQILQNEQKLLSQELTMKQQEIQKCERERMNLERELLQLRPLRAQLENYSSATQKTIEENVRNEYERGKLQSRITELQNDLEVQKRDFSDLNLKYNQMIQQNALLIEQLKLFEKESLEIQAKIRRGFEVERENENISKSVDQFKEKERDYLRQIEDLKSIIRQKDQEIDRLQNRTENVSFFQKTLEQDLRTSRDECERLKNLVEAAQNEALKCEQKRNQMEVEVVDLKRSNQQIREDKKRQDSEMADMRRECEEEREKARSLKQQVDRMKALVENLDSTKDDLVKRLQNTNHEKITEGQDKAILLNDIQAYKKELLIKDQEIADLRKSIEQLDSNIDDLQSELDQKTQELSACRLQLDKQTRDFSNVQHQLSVVAGKEDNFGRRMFERENEIKSLKVEVQHLREQLEEQVQIANIKCQECNELVEDIQTLTRENKVVNTEFAKVSQANDFLRKQNEDFQDKERQAQQSVRAIEMEKQDILTNYRNACIENERLNETVQQLSFENKEAYARLQQLEKDLYGYSHKVKDTDQREHNYIQEIHTLERHIDHLTRQLDIAHQALKESNEEKEMMMIEMNNHKNLNYSIELNQQDMQRHLATVDREKSLLNHQVHEAQREADIVKKQLEIERQRYADLERIVNNERKQKHDRDYNQNNVYRENDNLKAEIERLKLRIQSLQNHIDSLQKYGGSGGGSARISDINASSSKYQQQDYEEQLRAANEELDTLRRENRQYLEYIQKYENQIQELESQLNIQR